MGNFMSKLSGYKTYIIMAAMVLFGVVGLLLGRLDPTEAWKIILEGLAIGGLRNAIK